jgi:site-specific recombinase XerD
MNVADLRDLAESWDLQLRAERKSAETLKSYAAGVRIYLEWCEANDRAPLVKAHLNAWTVELLDGGAAPSTATSRQLGVRRFSAWLAEENEIPADPFLGVKSPKIDVPVIDPLTEDDLKALIRACQVAAGTDPKVAFRRRRDEAIIRLMIDTGARAGEVAVIALADVDKKNGRIIIRRGKGGKGREVSIGPKTVLAIDKYMRIRRDHRLAESPDLWLGDRGKGFTYAALHKTLSLRAKDAGIEDFHPHRLRHTFAHRWLENEGSETGLMAVAGWARPEMLARYTKAKATDRAIAEAKRLNLGEL